MKKILILAVLLGARSLASAATTNIYVQDWGTVNGGPAVTGSGTLGLVGWTAVAVSQTTGPYLGIYAATGASDPATGAALPVNTVYFTVLRPTQITPGMFYTTDTAGAGSGGDSSFSAIDPTLYTNLTLSVEVRGAATDTNYFAVRVGGSWYVSTTQLPGSGTLPYPQFTNATVAYTNAAAAWRNLTINTTDVTIGSTPGANLSGPITGIGIVELPTTGGFNYNQLAVTAFTPGVPPPTPPTITSGPISQSAYAGGGASFLVVAAGSPPLTYLWLTNDVPVAEGSKYSGTTNNLLTILNASADDAALTYSVIVTNVAGAATNTGFTLTVNPVPDDVLYAETFPYVGPNGDLPITGVSWLGEFQGGTGIFPNGAGDGIVFSYAGVATTNLYYTTTTNDTGASGLPLVPLNPDAYPNVTFRASFSPGNAATLNPSNVVAYWAVRMADGNWYSSTSRIPVQTIALNSYQPYELAFKRAAVNWNTLTIGAGSATIGNQAGSALAGNIIGAGIVIAHLGLNGGGDFNFDNFVLSTNAVSVLPPTIGLGGSPNSQTVGSGGGVSFGVAVESGSLPFTYGWTMNGVLLVNGGRVSGATTPTVTIANLNNADNGAAIVAYVTNSIGVDSSDLYTATTVTIDGPAVGLLYSETFPFVGPLAGNYSIASAGWVEAVAGMPNALYQRLGSDGAVFAFQGVPATTVYYSTTASDLNQAGLPFPNIKLDSYPDLTLAVDIEPGFQAENVTAYFAVQLNGTNWYVAASALPVPATGAFTPYTMAFDPAAANWNNLTVSGAGGIIGSPAAGNLGGVLTGAGLVFVTTGAGGDHNFDNFAITGTGLGGINVGPLTGGSLNLSWVGNPVVNLQSSTNLAAPNWQDVPNTLGLYSLPVPATEAQKFFRLKMP